MDGTGGNACPLPDSHQGFPVLATEAPLVTDTLADWEKTKVIWEKECS